MVCKAHYVSKVFFAIGGLGHAPTTFYEKFPLLRVNLEAVLIKHYEAINAVLATYTGSKDSRLVNDHLSNHSWWLAPPHPPPLDQSLLCSYYILFDFFDFYTLATR